MRISEKFLAQICEIDSPEAESEKSAYELGRYVASKKPVFDENTQIIFNDLLEKKLSINLSKINKIKNELVSISD